jgi:hypothetical protein
LQGSLKGKEQSKDLIHRWDDNIKRDREIVFSVWIGVIWLRIETGDYRNDSSGSTKDGEFDYGA